MVRLRHDAGKRGAFEGGNAGEGEPLALCGEGRTPAREYNGEVASSKPGKERLAWREKSWNS